MITVAGLTPSLDLTYLVPALRPGAIHRPNEVYRCAGGKGLNLARAAATVGPAPAVVAVLGGPTGAALAAELTAVGIAICEVPTPAETRVCVSIAADDAPGLTELYAYADPVPDDVLAAFRSELGAALAGRGGWLAIPGGPPRGSDPEVLADLVRIGRDAGCRVAVDTHGPALAPAIAAGPALVKVNRSEAAELLGCAEDVELAWMGAAVSDRLPDADAIVVLTDGQHGSLGVQAGRVWRVEPLPVVGRYPVGSGDAFLGGLLVALDAGSELDQALRLAAACGAANALVPGAGRFEASSAFDLAARISVRSVRSG